MKVAIWGAGGHGKVVYDVVTSMGHTVVMWFDQKATPGMELYGLPIHLPEAQDVPAEVSHIVALGDNATRARVFQCLRSDGHALLTAVHASAIVHRSVLLGSGTVVMPGAIINIDSLVGENCIVNTGATVDHDCRLLDHVHLAPGVHLAGTVQIGEGTLVGMGANVLPNRRIGSWSTVGAGTLVLRDVPDRVTVFGVPGRVRK